MSSPGSAPTIGATVCWVLLTTGNRPVELARAIASIPSGAEVVVVANGASDVEVPAGVRLVSSPTNLGIPGGRNLGTRSTEADIIVFLDDDATVAAPDRVLGAIDRFGCDPSLAAVCFRLVDPVSGTTARRHVPRLRAGDPARSGEVTSFLGGATAIRREAFLAVGGYPDDFFYALEETDLAWRLIDAGWSIWFAADAVVHHPRTEIGRHGDAHVRTARNRVLLARRLLPSVLAPVYVSCWAAITVARGRSSATVVDWWRGTRDGLRAEVDRRPISWRTVWRLTRLGRPPVV